MLKSTRRNFLKFAAAAPLAAKSVAAQLGAGSLGTAMDAAKLAGVGISTDNYINQPPGSGPVPMDEAGRIREILTYLKIFGVPEWKRKDIRNSVRWSRTLDPDIACMRSISLQAKMTMQWNRSERKALAAQEQALWDELSRAKWFSLNKIGWW